MALRSCVCSTQNEFRLNFLKHSSLFNTYLQKAHSVPGIGEAQVDQAWFPPWGIWQRPRLPTHYLVSSSFLGADDFDFVQGTSAPS